MRKTAGAIALAIALSGCSDAPIPQGTYTLVGSEAGPLPLRLNGGDNCFHMLMSGSVRVMAGASYASEMRVEIACPGKGMQHRSLGGAGKFVARRDSIVFRDTTGQLVGRAALRNDTIAIDGPLHRLFYVRQ